MKPQILVIIVVLWLMTGGCATSEKTASSRIDPPDSNQPHEPGAEEYGLFEEGLTPQVVKVADPLEPLNRTMFGVNDTLYFWVAKPVMQTYEKVVPKPARLGIDNFFHNLTTPARLVNCLLQGKRPGADRELKRFALNTTVGVLGFGDPAQDRWHVAPAEEDLGQTLAVAGLGDGFYVVLPILGPSTARDSVGLFGDHFLNPVWYVKPLSASIGISAVNVTNKGSFHIGEYEAFKSAAVDPYVAMRGAYIQYRQKQIAGPDQPTDPNNGKP